MPLMPRPLQRRRRRLSHRAPDRNADLKHGEGGRSGPLRASGERSMTRTTTRVERDTFGPIEVPADRLWGAQTQRSLEHFRISTEKMPPALIRALLIVKRSAARVNIALGTIDKKKADAIIAAADEALAGKHAGE